MITSLYADALRQGQSLWFRVASSSMRPLLHIGDAIHIEPATAGQIRVGDIAAFETVHGLVVHRIIARKRSGTRVFLLQMADSEMRPNWIEQNAVVGRVTAIRWGEYYVQLRTPLARTCGGVIAFIRYQLYANKQATLKTLVLSICSRIALRIGCWCVRLLCVSSHR